jgi:sulfite reductase (NADPH) flavoprotein alpha-component
MPDDSRQRPPAPMPAAAPAPARRRSRASLPTLRQAWFQLHWLIGITAGTVLVVIGLTGATLSFREEILDLFNPGVRHVAAGPARMAGLSPLTPQQIAAAAGAARPGRIANITLFSAAGASPRLVFAPPPGQRRGETVYINPYTGAIAPPLAGAEFFEWVESLHRWLLLPREPGRGVAGTLALCLLGMALSGLYLRWPRRALSWRTWLTFDPALRGRSFLWGLHSVLGTWALLIYLVSTGSGIYWSFDVVRDQVDGWAGGRLGKEAPASPGGKNKKADGGKRAPVSLDAAWSAFQQQGGRWESATLRVPERAGQPVQISWLAADAAHERARSRMVIDQASGQVTLDERYERQPRSQRFLAAIYPLHMGTYFGLAGRIAMMLGALSLPVFAVTGWMLYLGRRRSAREALAERSALDAALPPSTGVTPAALADTILVAYASQSGQAERLALRSAAALTRGGLTVSVQALGRLAPRELKDYGRVLLVASSFGEGDAPDGARRFHAQLNSETASLAGVHYGLLALGDRHYAQFCGFGRALDAGLRRLGATPLFAAIEVDDGDAAALKRWSARLGELAGTHAAGAAPMLHPEEIVAYDRWRLVRRTLLNPGSQGGALFELALAPAAGAALPDWQAGALVEVLPRHAPGVVAAFLQTAGLDGDEQVEHDGRRLALAELLARCTLPAPAHAFTDAQSLANQLKTLAARSYSLASLPHDGEIQLLVRQERHEQGLGLASGWLTAHAPLGADIDLRLVANAAFAPADTDVPCLYIGNGSGLAGLRAHLRARVAAGHRRNWLLFGERESAIDMLCAGEIDGWLAAGFLQRMDRVFSRDAQGRAYVQDRLREAGEELRQLVAAGGIVYVCGSLKGMAAGVDAALTDLLGKDGMDALCASGRYRRDVY